MVETLDLEIIAPLLNDYLGGMTEIVFAHGGTVVKIVGDAMHVLFGAPADQPDHAARAVACALELDAYAQAFRVRWLGRGIALGATRLGLSAGPALVGNFGGNNYFDYTAHGDTINTAARLESANKQLGTRICVGDSVATVSRALRAGRSAICCLRGRKEPRCARSSRWRLPPMTTRRRAYLEAFAKLEAGGPNGDAGVRGASWASQRGPPRRISPAPPVRTAPPARSIALD